MVEDGVGMQLVADLLGQSQLVFGDGLDEVMHLVGVGHVVHQRLVDGAEVVALLKEAGGHKDGVVGNVAVNLLAHALADVPQLVGELERGHLHIVLPVLDVLDNDLLRGMYGEAAGRTLGPHVGDAPGVHNLRAALLGAGGGHHGRGKGELHSLILVYETVWVASPNHLTHIFLRVKHTVVFLSYFDHLFP